MNHRPDEPEEAEEGHARAAAPRPTLRLVSSRDEESGLERPDAGLRRLLRSPLPPFDDEDDDPGPSAA